MARILAGVLALARSLVASLVVAQSRFVFPTADGWSDITEGVPEGIAPSLATIASEARGYTKVAMDLRPGSDTLGTLMFARVLSGELYVDEKLAAATWGAHATQSPAEKLAEQWKWPIILFLLGGIGVLHCHRASASHENAAAFGRSREGLSWLQ